jgi:hypothetical protein
MAQIEIEGHKKNESLFSNGAQSAQSFGVISAGGILLASRTRLQGFE